MKKTRTLLHTALACSLLALTPMGCDLGTSFGNKAKDLDLDPDAQGTLIVKLTDAPLDDVDSVFVTFSELAVHRCTDAQDPKEEGDSGEQGERVADTEAQARQRPDKGKEMRPAETDTVLDGEKPADTDTVLDGEEPADTHDLEAIKARLEAELARVDGELAALQEKKKQLEEGKDFEALKEVLALEERMRLRQDELKKKLDRLVQMAEENKNTDEEHNDEKEVPEEDREDEGEGDVKEEVDDELDEDDQDDEAHQEEASGCANGTWERIELGDTRRFDLLTLQNGVTADFGMAKLPAGKYGQFRIMLQEVTVVSGDQEVSVKVPSGAQTGLKFNGGFEIEAGKDLELTIDFDAGKSLKFNKGQGWMLKPVIKLLK